MTKIQLKRSSVLNNATTSRAPTSAQLDYGELAINYNTADPQFFIKDSNGSVIRVLDAYAKVDGTTFTGDVNFDGNVRIKGDSTNGAGKLTLSCETDTYSVNIKAPPTSAAASYTLTLPTSAGSSNQVLVTDGSGGLSWALSAMTTADKNKLDGIESGATADQTGAEIKTLYEAEADTNAFTDALLNKLNNIASGAQVNVATNLGKSTATTSVTITSSTGTDVTIGEATGSIAGLMTTAHHNKLDGIEAGATADQTAAEILTAIKTVDGSGSGLDADTLDGIQGSSYLRSDTSDTFSGGTLTVNGGSGLAIMAESTGFAEQLEVHRNHSTQSPGIKFSNDTGQIGILFAAQSGYVLRWRDGTTTNSHKIWHSGNDGSGSGLDADTLDGNQASAFALKSGATFTGEIQCNARLDVGDGSDGNHEIRIYKADNDVSDHIQFYNGTTRVGEIGCKDTTWLRINQDTAKNIYTPRYIRADGGFFVDGTTKGINGSGNFVGGTIAGASDYSTLLRSNANDVIGGVLSYHSNDARLQFRNTSYNTYLYIGGWSNTNSNDISRIRNSSGNLHIDSAANGNLYLNHYSTGTIYARGSTVWHAGNDGSGSGLDADTLDGIQGSSYLRSDTSDTFSGGTLTVNGGSGLAIKAESADFAEQLEIHRNHASNAPAIKFSNDTAQTGILYADSGGVLRWRNGTSSNTHQIWHAGNDGSGSGLDADNLDGYSWTSSGKNVRGTEIYADNWFRNYNSGEGLYNEANAMYWFSDNNTTYRVRSNQTSVRIAFATSSNNIRGYVYADTASSIGFLNTGGQWGLRYLCQDGKSPNLYFREESNETWTGDPGNDMGKIEYHSNRFYIAAGANSTEVVRFRRSNTNVAYISNAGNIYATSSNHVVWHAGNDGSGSGLDADTLDGVSSGSFLRSDANDSYSGTINGSGSFAVQRQSSYSPGAGNSNTGIVLRGTGISYFSYNGVGAYFNRNSDGDLISYRRSGTEEGSVEINTSRVYFRTTSDYRRKKNVTPIANGIDVIKALKPSAYNWIEDNRLDHGFLAHEIQEHVPGSASGYKDEVDEEGEPVYQKVDLTTVVPFLTAALKDSIARIESLEAEVVALKSQLDS